MHLRCVSNTRYSGAILAALLLAGAFSSGLASVTASRAYVSPDEWDEVFDTARAVLAKMPDAARIETLKEPGLREAMLRAHRALKACAKVNRSQSRSIKQATLFEFESAFKSVQTEAVKGEHQACATTCKTAAGACENDCASAKKKLCACKLTEFGCFAKCIFG